MCYPFHFVPLLTVRTVLDDCWWIVTLIMLIKMGETNADSYRDLSSKKIFRNHGNEKKRQCSNRVMEIEQGSFTSLVFSTTGEMAEE